MSATPQGTLLLVDGLSMAFRAFFGLPVENFSTSTGTPTNAVYGFTTMLATLMRDREPTHVAVAFDLPGGTFRTERLPSYKGTRDATPPEFEPQVPLIREMLQALGVASVDKERYEADDLLATYARLGSEAGLRVLVVSGDRDTIQLVNDDVTLLYPRKGVSDLVEFTPDAVREKYGVAPGQYPDLAALVGETSDNLPGVPGVGPKTAAKWIGVYGGLEEILSQADDVPGKAGQSLRDHLDQVRLNRELNHLLTDLEVPLDLEALSYGGADAQAIHEMCDALQFRTLRDRLLPFVVGDAEAPAESRDEVEVVLEGAVDAVTALTGAVTLHVDGRTGADADAWAVGVFHGGEAWGIDLSSLTSAEEESLTGWLADATVPKTLHGAKDAWHSLAARGIELRGIVGDTQIAAFLVNPDQRGFDLDSVLQRYLGAVPSASAGGDELDLGLSTSPGLAAGERAAHVAALADLLDAEVESRGMSDLYADLEIPLVSVLARMEDAGIAVDTAHLDSLSDEALGRAALAAQDAYDAIGGDQVNLGSPKQLQEVLFERLGMPKTRKIKTGYSTDAGSLQELHAKRPHPFLEALLAHRDSTKLAQIIKGLASEVRADGRIHTTFSQTVAATGRLSSRDPNLQNIPIRTDEGHRIREAFVVGAEFETLVTADYSQIEMRIMAHLSGDEALIEAFRGGEDLHRFVGARVFGVEPEDVTPHMRSQVKAMSYGLAYGLSSFGLSKQLGLEVSQAQALMDDYFARFGAVRDYLKGVVAKAREDGYTETIFGRRRYMPDLSSTNRQRREIAERAALNAPIQGSAADLIKRAMLGVEDRLRDERLASRQVLQVHDELVVETAPGERDAVEAILREEMGGAADLAVPLDVNVGAGATWRAAGH
ncbi:DNA polymerase I [Demequina zhanjiangensis]|uniref:DNA polymerase I n=1 Tax=Demequina zhanjiangensis TaxID=3051659 RepID=A0ABT8G1Z4_9MICO|nr:DNA polymerase I [Demequina sp. SYSU T00b26]MDN4473155.1 DNA polymerase I [Demequina sp. SYSU T00b26]